MAAWISIIDVRRSRSSVLRQRIANELTFTDAIEAFLSARYLFYRAEINEVSRAHMPPRAPPSVHCFATPRLRPRGIIAVLYSTDTTRRLCITTIPERVSAMRKLRAWTLLFTHERTWRHVSFSLIRVSLMIHERKDASDTIIII